MFLGEEEISDVSLATFYVFDKENAGSLKPGVQLARGGCGGGCGHGCGGGGGCRGCGGCRGGSAWLWRRLQNRLRLWRLRRVWMRRMRPGLVGSLRRRVRCRCRLLHILGRLPLLLARNEQIVPRQLAGLRPETSISNGELPIFGSVSLCFCVRSCPARPELVATIAAPDHHSRRHGADDARRRRGFWRHLRMVFLSPFLF